RNRIARLHANGILDEGFIPETGAGATVHSLALQPNGKVLVTRDSRYDGTNFHNISRLNADGTKDAGFLPGTGADGEALVLALRADGDIFVGGSFTTVRGMVRPNVVRLHGDALPFLGSARSNGMLTLSWPISAGNFRLQEAANVLAPASWNPTAQAAVTNGSHVSVTVPTTGAMKFFRLQSQ
ncbi:MAG TPA: hypothetical protein DCY13_21745, partial [Verrucomicrobiales bacterium]|nr:hypothetical protein [Verrucomicrobiales bacterium]